jgi:hypothetical protein
VKILLGDNQFFGVNHSNLKKAVETQKLFSSSENIIEFIKKSHEIGINGFMINSNDLGYKVVAQFPFMSFPEKECHFSIPYPHKYAALVNETGILGLLKFILRRIRPVDFKYVLQFLLSSNAAYLVPTIVRLEIPKNLPKGSVIYLQNVVTDLILGLDNGHKLIDTYINAVENLGYKAGIITLNPLHFRKSYEEYGKHKDLYLCFNINKIGFNVFPSVEDVTKEIDYIKNKTKWKIVGMSIFSSGAQIVTISESIEFIKSIDFDYIVFGSSKLNNIKENYLKFNT